MGRRHDWICGDCSYSVVTSAGRDRGFFAMTETFVCLDCKEIVDGIIGEQPTRMGKVEAKEPHCPKCEGNNLIVWDLSKKPCPKCGHELKLGKTRMEFWD